MAKKRIAHKIELHVDPAGGTTFTQIASIKRISDPSHERDAIDVTCLESDIEDGRPSPVLKIGDLTFQLFWDEADTDHQTVFSLITGTQPGDADDDPSWKIVFPFSTSISKVFRGWLKGIGEAPYEVKGEVMRDVTIHITKLGVST